MSLAASAAMAVAPPVPGRPQAPKSLRQKFPCSIEDQVRLNYFTPAPNSYDLRGDITEPRPLGRISDSKLPSALDYHAKKRAFVPGPGSYETPDLRSFSLPEGGRLNRVAPAPRLQVDEYPIPPPGTYGIPNDPTQPRNVNGRFSRDPRVTAFIREAEMRSRGNPAPGAHEVLESMEMAKPFCPDGGRWSTATKPKSYFDVAPTLSKANPPPGSYEHKDSVNPNRAVGRIVYRYESATIGETKDLITKVVGDANDAPGPGHYSLPDPKPLGCVPSQKGKSLPYAMPHPFAYNCAPDHGRKFLTPVRKRNNAAQIYGTGVQQGAAELARQNASKSNRPQDSRNDLDQMAELPYGAADEEKPIEEEGVVHWRSGGFSKLKKSRSASVIRSSDLDPVIKNGVGKFYPPLGEKERSAKAFLPMSTRRTEHVSTRIGSEENQCVGEGKWKLSKVMENLENATAAALEPLEIDKMKDEAMKDLRDKAIDRMKLQGVGLEQQQVILEEMDSLLEERSLRPPGAESALAGEDYVLDANDPVSVAADERGAPAENIEPEEYFADDGEDESPPADTDDPEDDS